MQIICGRGKWRNPQNKMQKKPCGRNKGRGERLNDNEFNKPKNWTGGFYELSIEFDSADNKGLNQALIALKNFKLFNGFWKDRQDFGSHSITLPITFDEGSVHQLYGMVSLFGGHTLPCLISLIKVQGESDWVDLSIPQATLEQFYSYKYPLTKKLNPWLAKVDEIFIKIAETIFNHSPFALAMIGEEISGYKNQAEITLEDVKEITSILPIRVQKRLGIQGQGKELTNQLRLFD